MDFYNSNTMTDTLSSIIRKEVLNDKIANAVLKEEIYLLDEFKIIGRTLGKLKKLGKRLFLVQRTYIKIMKKVKQSLDKIKRMGAKMFQTLFKFLGIELKSVRVSLPSEMEGFV